MMQNLKPDRPETTLSAIRALLFALSLVLLGIGAMRYAQTPSTENMRAMTIEAMSALTCLICCFV